MTDTLQGTLERYLRLCSQTLRPSTVRGKRLDIQDMLRFLRLHHPEVRSWAELRRVPHIEGWLHHLHQSHLKPSTRTIRIGNLHRFLDDMIHWQWPDATPPDLIHPDDLPPKEHPLPKPLPHDVDQAVQEALRRQPTLTSRGLLLLRLTGMRIGEMIDLNLNALDARGPNNCTLHVPMGKTRSERVIPVNEQTVDLVQAIQKQRGSNLDPQSLPPSSAEYLMVNPRGRRPVRATYWLALKTLTRHIPTTEHIHPHRLRHTFATEMIRAGMSLPALMKVLGHDTASMTMRYVEIATPDLQREYDKAIQQLAVLRNLDFPDPLNPCSTTNNLRVLLNILIQCLETRHRDTADTATASRLARFVKRLRRTRDDLNHLLDKAR